MRNAIKTHLPSDNTPMEWAVSADGILYTSQIPIREDGSLETGDITKQTTLTMDNLKRTVEAAGGTMDDVTHVLAYLTSPEDFAGMNAVYVKYFREPYPNRATVVVALTLDPGGRIEIVAYAHIGKGKTLIQTQV